MVRRTTATRERLSRETVTASALDLADREGLEALTIRRLATELGVTPMALYWHFDDKEALVDAVAERVLAEVALPPDDASAPWRQRLRAALAALLAALRAHPTVVDQVKLRIISCPPGQDVSERVIGILRGAGFTTEQASAAAVLALASMVGMVTAEPGLQPGGTDVEEHEQRVRTRRAGLQALNPARYPNLIAAADSLSDCHDEQLYFEGGLDMLVAGIAAQLEPPS
jgi:AcrR family transcriptional regulator